MTGIGGPPANMSPMRPSGRPRNPRAESGYAMAGLLVAIGIMSILMSAAMPAWRTYAKREREAELLFRGQQYMRAVELYQRRFPGAYPTDLEALVEERFLRRPYRDPMTGEPFRILTQGSAAAAAGEAATEADDEDEDDRPRSRLSERAGRGGFGAPGSGLGGRAGMLAPGPFSGTLGGDDEELGGIVGVVSRSSEDSLLEYNGATRYDQWLFVHQPQAAAAGTVAPGLPGVGTGSGGPTGIGGAGDPFDPSGLSRRPGRGFGDGPGRGRMRGR